MTNLLPVSQAARDLLPCPVCGNRAFVAHGNAAEVNGFPVWCLTDRCLRLPPRETEAEAITAWNTRRGEREPAPSSERELVERLRHIRRDGCYCADAPKKAGLLHPVCQEAADTIEHLAATTQEPALDLHTLEEAKRDRFNAGYLLAVSNLVNLHGAETEAEDVLAELGVTEGVLKRLELTDYDAKPLRKLFRSISRKARALKGGEQ